MKKTISLAITFGVLVLCVLTMGASACSEFPDYDTLSPEQTEELLQRCSDILDSAKSDEQYTVSETSHLMIVSDYGTGNQIYHYINGDDEVYQMSGEGVCYWHDGVLYNIHENTMQEVDRESLEYVDSYSATISRIQEQLNSDHPTSTYAWEESRIFLGIKRIRGYAIKMEFDDKSDFSTIEFYFSSSDKEIQCFYADEQSTNLSFYFSCFDDESYNQIISEIEEGTFEYNTVQSQGG